MQIDITLLGRFLTARAADLGVADAAHAADEWVAVYRECQLFAFLPYQLLFSVTQVLFPLVARAHAGGDSASVAAYTARGARIGAVVGGLMVAVVAAMPASLLGFAFSAEVGARGGAALRVLALGQGAFALLGLATTVLVSLGREREAAGITAATLVLIAGGCVGVVPSRDFGTAQLVATALATSLGLAFGLALAATRVTQVAGAFIPRLTAVRVAIAAAATIAVGASLPPVGRLLAPVEAVALAIVYLVVLVATREIGGADARLVTSLVRRQSPAR
jgi:stage V sporulation protein B